MRKAMLFFAVLGLAGSLWATTGTRLYSCGNWASCLQLHKSRWKKAKKDSSIIQMHHISNRKEETCEHVHW